MVKAADYEFSVRTKALISKAFGPDITIRELGTAYFIYRWNAFPRKCRTEIDEAISLLPRPAPVPVIRFLPPPTLDEVLAMLVEHGVDSPALAIRIKGLWA